jgi:hypothetical protein
MLLMCGVVVWCVVVCAMYIRLTTRVIQLSWSHDCDLFVYFKRCRESFIEISSPIICSSAVTVTLS